MSSPISARNIHHTNSYLSMSQSINLTTGHSPRQTFSFRRLGRLLQLDFAFYRRQWLLILLAGILAACGPLIVTVLSSLVFGFGGDDATARGVLISCSFISFITISLTVMMSYNSRLNAPLSPLYLQVPASHGEKYISLVILTLILNLIAPLIGLLVWSLYMLIWALFEGVVVLHSYPEIIRNLMSSCNIMLQYGWSTCFLIGIQLASFAIYLYCIISSSKPIRTIVRYLGICFGIFVASMICLIIFMNVGSLERISIDETNQHILLFLRDEKLSISPFILYILIYLFAFIMIRSGYRSLKYKQVKA